MLAGLRMREDRGEPAVPRPPPLPLAAGATLYLGRKKRVEEAKEDVLI